MLFLCLFLPVRNAHQLQYPVCPVDKLRKNEHSVLPWPFVSPGPSSAPTTGRGVGVAWRGVVRGTTLDESYDSSKGPGVPRPLSNDGQNLPCNMGISVTSGLSIASRPGCALQSSRQCGCCTVYHTEPVIQPRNPRITPFERVPPTHARAYQFRVRYAY